MGSRPCRWTDKTMMKKILSLLLAALICTGTVACANAPAEGEANTQTAAGNNGATDTVSSESASETTGESSAGEDPDNSAADTGHETGEKTEADTATGTTSDTQVAENTGEGDTSADTESLQPDALPGLNFEKEEFNIFCPKDSPDLVGDVEGDVVEVAIHERNLMVEKRLNVRLINMEDGSADPMSVLQTYITAGDDVVDIVSGMQYQAIQQAYNNLYTNVADGEYLDWEKPWWANDYMDTIQWNEKRYILVGDISLSLLKSMSAFFVNKSLFEDNFESLDTLYETVFSGEWTWDKMTTYVSEVYHDKNGNGKTDDGDILGLRTYHESPTDHMAYTAGMALSTRDENGDIILLTDQSRNIEIASVIYKLCYENKGCYLSLNFNTFDDHVINSFNNGDVLFCAYLMIAAESFRDMKDPYAIIPYPKLDLLQEDYMTLMHDFATVFAVPKTVSADDLDRHSAVLEAMCSESYRKVTPVYYDVVLKSRYSQDPPSAMAVDMIRSNIRTDFIYANNYIFSGTPLGTINRTLISTNNTNYASVHKRYSMRIQKELNKINEGNIKAD